MAFRQSVAYQYIAIILWSLAVFIISIILWIEIKSLFCSKSQLIRVKTVESQTYNSPTSDPSNDSRSKSAASRTLSMNKLKSKRQNHKKATYILPIFCYSSYLIACVSALLAVAASSSDKMCSITARLASVSYTFAKMWMYLVFVYRLKIIYDDSMFSYKHNIIYIMMSGIIIYSMGIIIATLLLVSTDVSGSNICGIIWVFGILEAQVLLDLLTNSLCCYFFVRPLKILLKKDEDSDKDNMRHREKMYFIIRKNVILTFVAVVSTFFILVFLAISGLNAFASIDVVFNCFCIMMFNGEHIRFYNSLCCLSKKVALKCCVDKIANKEID